MDKQPGRISLSPETYFKLLSLNVSIIEGPAPLHYKFLDLNDESGAPLRYKYIAADETPEARKIVKILPRIPEDADNVERF